MEATLFTREEERRVIASLRSGEPTVCPRCQMRLEQRDVPPSRGVAYVRSRLLLVCGGCGRSLVVDRRRLDERSGG